MGISKKFVFESFNDFINEKNKDRNLKINEAVVKPEPWDFQFDSGKFKKSEVSQEQFKILKADFEKRIVPVFSNESLLGQKLIAQVTSASSKVPVNPTGTVAKALKAAGYSANNEGLCKARGVTMVELISDLMYDAFGEGMDRKEFFKGASDKIEFDNNPTPNIGPEYDKASGDSADDNKFKENQYITASMRAKGEKIPDPLILACNSVGKPFKGGKADVSNGFAGYDETVYLRAKAGNMMEISFDPLVVPDSMLFSYSGKEAKLTPFMGSFGAKWIYGKFTPESEKRILNDGRGIKAERITIDKIPYLMVDYKKQLNEVVNAGGVLVKAIEKRLKDLGLKPIKEICPEFFDAEGKIEVYRNKELSQIKALYTEGAGATTYNLLNAGKIKQSPKIEGDKISIKIKKNAVRDSVTLVAFSPISGTVFKIDTKCS